MKRSNFLLVIFLFCSIAAIAQPVWSPEVRAKREAEWMQDSLHLTAEQLQKVNPILLNYQQKHVVGLSPEEEHELMENKDAAMKAVLNKQQYKKYYRREKQIRALPKPDRTGPHQPY